jgi:hypothetical protein
MKQIMAMGCLFLMLHVQAQIFNNSNLSGSAIQFGTGYVHDIKSINGWGTFINCRLPLNDFLAAGIGIRTLRAAGHPNTQYISEHTNATALDFSLMYMPLHTERVVIRMGLLYSFSRYNIARSYPVYNDHTSPANQPNWLPLNEKGFARGMGLMGAMEYFFGEKLSAGLRLSYCQAYTEVFMVGPFVAIPL